MPLFDVQRLVVDVSAANGGLCTFMKLKEFIYTFSLIIFIP